MADIKRYTDKIRYAIYGREVRGSLADGIEAINSDVINNKTDVDNGVNEMRNFENRINQAENTRVSNENTRKAAENERINNENARKAAESTRQSNENTRVSNENNRINAENTRSNNENTRQHNESGRSNAENTRVNNENARNQAESTRNNNENARKAAETSRANAENTRSNNENTRISNEEARKSNESNRTTKFNQLDKQAQDLISDMKQIVGNIDDRYYRVLRGTVSDFNDCLSEGQYSFGSGSTIPNAPVSGSTYGVLLVYVNDGGTHNNSTNWIWQDVYTTNGSHFWRYKVNNSAWNDWKREYNTTFRPTPDDIGAVPYSSNNAMTIHADADSSSQEEYLSLQAGKNDLRVLSSGASQSADALLFNGNKIYHEGHKPTYEELGFGAWSLGGRDLTCYGKRAVVGFNTNDGNRLYLNYANDFAAGTWCDGRFHVGSDDKFIDIGTSDSDVAIGNSKSGRWLQLKDDGILSYANQEIFTKAHFANNLANPGYQKFPGGLVIQWGYVSGINSKNLFTVNLPIALQENNYVAIVTASNGNNVDPKVKTVYLKGTNFKIQAYADGLDACWLVIGHV